ncbi:hypothetical protein [Nocardia wallacei]|uniref:hypothetical protein n=1 Tax=Nocardia wallacei TaxID=480035 RepID=UPI002453FB8A|nr:hypothetical protein [Nocardia wallacei]
MSYETIQLAFDSGRADFGGDGQGVVGDLEGGVEFVGPRQRDGQQGQAAAEVAAIFRGPVGQPGLEDIDGLRRRSSWMRQSAASMVMYSVVQ